MPRRHDVDVRKTEALHLVNKAWLELTEEPLTDQLGNGRVKVSWR